MERNLFILLPAPSHYFACFPFAKSLQIEGKLVIFVGSISLKKIVESEGFLFNEIKYTKEYSISSFKVFLGLLIRSSIDKTLLYRRYREWIEGIQMLNQIFCNNQPTKVYLDDHLSHYYPILLNKCRNIEIINTKFSTKKSVNSPPLDSSFIPQPNFLSLIVCELLWLIHLKNLQFREAIVKLALLNREEDYFGKRFAIKQEIALANMFDRKNCFYKGLNGVNVLILAPASLEFPCKLLKPNERYFDIPINRNEQSQFSDEYLIFAKKSQVLKEEGNKLIYCSFGTLGAVNVKKIIRFSRCLFTIFEQEKKWYLVFSTGGIKLEKTPSNVFLFDYVPQLSLLKNCDLMITHGGLTSLKECIQNRVPMLIYPLNNKTDQLGNAARAICHGFGLRGKISTDSIKDIRKKIKILLDH
jgi:zeaxanthin glucosyltransferase